MDWSLIPVDMVCSKLVEIVWGNPAAAILQVDYYLIGKTAKRAGCYYDMTVVVENYVGGVGWSGEEWKNIENCLNFAGDLLGTGYNPWGRNRVAQAD